MNNRLNIFQIYLFANENSCNRFMHDLKLSRARSYRSGNDSPSGYCNQFFSEYCTLSVSMTWNVYAWRLFVDLFASLLCTTNPWMRTSEPFFTGHGVNWSSAEPSYGRSYTNSASDFSSGFRMSLINEKQIIERIILKLLLHSHSPTLQSILVRTFGKPQTTIF